MIAPTPATIRSIRAAAGLTQSQAAAMVHAGGLARWAEYERGRHLISLADWELFLIKTGNHESYLPVQDHPAPTRAAFSAFSPLAYAVNLVSASPAT